MKKHKKNFLTLYILITILFLGYRFVDFAKVNAQDFTQQLKTFANKSGAGDTIPTDPRIVVAQLVKFLLGMIGIMFFAYSVYAGYLIMSSAGDEEKVKKGKSTLRTGIIGIFVIMSAYSILALVSSVALNATQDKPPAYFDYDIGTSEYDACIASGGTVSSCSRGL